MKCDRCGSHFSARDAETDTSYEAVEPPGRMPYTELAGMIICPSCVASRVATRRLIYWMVGFIVGTLALIAFIQSLGS